jgi:hypothetical protein
MKLLVLPACQQSSEKESREELEVENSKMKVAFVILNF